LTTSTARPANLRRQNERHHSELDNKNWFLRPNPGSNRWRLGQNRQEKAAQFETEQIKKAKERTRAKIKFEERRRLQEAPCAAWCRPKRSAGAASPQVRLYAHLQRRAFEKDVVQGGLTATCWPRWRLWPADPARIKLSR
jgi:hypothetical protein